MSDYASLCVLSYERPEFLEQTIESAISNAGRALEVIVHDDGSTNGRVQDYLTDALNMGIISSVILNKPGHNQGQGTALNRMFHMASGDPIIKCDQDLIFSPGWMTKVDRILEDDRVGLLGLFKYWHEPVNYRNTGVTIANHIAPNTHSYHTHICGSAMVIPRHVWEALGPFEEHSTAFAEDAGMQAEVHASEWECALPEPDDLVQNIGFGIPNSTVVHADFSVHDIHTEPFLIR